MERADRQRLSRRQAEARYTLKRGKGNAYIEFDALQEVEIGTPVWPSTCHEYVRLMDHFKRMNYGQGQRRIFP